MLGDPRMLRNNLSAIGRRKLIPDTKFLEEIAAEVDLNRVLKAPMSGTTALSRADVEQRLNATDALIASVQNGSALVGEMPPQPPTFRATLGRILVSIVRRSVFWLTAQIRSFQTAVAASQKEHAQLLRAQAAEQLRLRQMLEAVDAHLQGSRTDLGKLSDRVDDLGALRESLDDIREDIRARADALRNKQEEVFGQLLRKLQEVLVRVEDLKKQTQQQQALGGQLQALSGELQTLNGQLQAQIQSQGAQLKGELRVVDRYMHQTRLQLALQERRVTTLFREVRRSEVPSPAENGTHGNSDDTLITDPLYVEFENIYRGDRADIKQRLECYIPRLKDSTLGHPEMAVLDLGCGRGEWLELLRDEGMTASGIDLNPVMIEECRSRGLSAITGDAIAYLRSLPPGSRGVVTGFHIVEHLPLNDLLALLDEAGRVLRPGGMVIFETPNPSNLLVSTENFYLDPTHRNPLPKDLLRFLVEARGLCDVQVVPLHPYPPSYRLEDDGRPSTRLLNQLLFSEQDYAVIGRKA